MSKFAKGEVDCPNCRETQEVEVWSSLNTTISPEAKDALLDGGINVFTCSKCEREFYVPAELLYHDPEKRFCVLFASDTSLRDENFLKRFSREGEMLLELVPGLGEGELGRSLVNLASKLAPYFSSTHVVFSRDELIRYVLFRDLLSEMASNENGSPKPAS